MATSISRAAWAFGLLMVYMAVTVGLRMYTQHKRTGSAGFKGLAGKPGSAESIGGILFVTAGAAGLAGALLQSMGVIAPISALDRFAIAFAGLVLFAA